MLIGLIGKSGSGKTTISLLFKELNKDIQILEVDKLGHASHDDPIVRKKLFKYFGNKIFNKDGTVNRAILSSIVFNDADMMSKLYDATSEFIEDKIEELIKPNTITILDYALLPNSRFFNLCDFKILVTAPYITRCQRVTKRDNISIAKYNERNSNSMNYSNFTFDYTISNNGNICNLRKVVGEIYEKSIISR